MGKSYYKIKISYKIQVQQKTWLLLHSFTYMQFLWIYSKIIIFFVAVKSVVSKV